jgi:hypothetical protein
MLMHLSMLSPRGGVGRLLARVLKEGGVEKTFPWKTFEVYITSCQYLFQALEFFSNTLGFVSLCRYVSLLNYDIFIQPGTPSN